MANHTIKQIILELPKSIDVHEKFEPFEGFSTKAIHSGHPPFDHDGIGNPVIPPITLSTTFMQREPGSCTKYDYSRGGNYSREVLEKCISTLENGNQCCTFSSGLAATNAVVQLLSSGDHVVTTDDLYGGTNRFFRQIANKFKIEQTPVDMSDISNVSAAINASTKIVWIETPTNPLLKLVDIKAVSTLVHKTNPSIIVVVDNTFMSSYFQRPLELGADIVMHSITKYMNGHTDVVMGALITKSKELADRITFLQFAAGAVPSPFDCYLVNRGLKTLALRMREHMRNGLAVARFLEAHPKVEKVLHPGLPSHPQFELGRRQMHGYSGMVSVYVRGGKEETVGLLKKLKLFLLAESLGGYESLIEIPSIMTHASVPPEQRVKLGITDNLLRLSVGCEDIQDLLNDLDQGLNSMEPSSNSRKRRNSSTSHS